MKFKETIPVISSLVIVIEGLKYKETLCTIEVTCNSYDGKGDRWHYATARCEEPYFLMGSGFWKDQFGTRQTNRIKKLCDIAIEKFMKEEVDE